METELIDIAIAATMAKRACAHDSGEIAFDARTETAGEPGFV